MTSAGVITITGGLTKGSTYTLTVAATNSTGTGASSGSSGNMTTWTEPGAPTIGTATEVDATTATIAFTAGTTGGTPILDYTATAYISGVATLVTATGTTSPITVTGLTQGTTYTFKVTARNSVGTGTASNASNTVQPADKPSKPTAPTVSTSTTYTADGRVTITFTAPYDGGTTILDYSFVSNPATTTQTVTQAGGGTYLFTGLVKGTAYTFSYAARNRIGTSTYSDASSSITPLTVPSAPGISTALRYDATTVSVAYTNSTDNGGTTITSYTATSSPSGITGSGVSSPILVTGLTKGQPYTFTVHANNSRGASGESTSSNSATPATVPNAPTIGTATTISKNSASISFTAPADNGGNTIISYTAVSSPGGISNTITQAGSGTITLTGLNPATNYTFVVYATNTYGSSANSLSSNQITTTNSYAVSASPTTINESSNKTVTFTVDTIGISNGTTMYWTNTGTTGSADFTDGVNSGSFTISASGSPPVGTATITRTTVADIFTEGPETVIFNLQYPSGTTVATTTVNVTDTSLTPTPTYSITEDTTSINETTNRTVTFSISTTYVSNGTTLYWQLYTGVQAADFTAGVSTGSVTISGASGTPATGGTASFSLTTTTDHLTEGSEFFFIYLGTNSPASSFNVATTNVITISDTSLTYGVITLSAATSSQNIVKTANALTVSGSFVVTMSSGTVGTITTSDQGGTNAFSAVTITPSSRTFTALSQTQTVNWSLTTNAVDYAATSYTRTIGVILDTSSGSTLTHTITLNRIAYTESVTISPTSGYTNTNFTYTVSGAPGTTFYWYSSVNATQTTGTLGGSVGDASAGTTTFGPANYWVSPGTYTVYVVFSATGNTKSVAVTVTYPPVTVTVSGNSGTGQVGTPWSGSQTTAYPGSSVNVSASGGSGGTYTYSVTSGSLPTGVSITSSGGLAGLVTGTPTASGFYSATITATNGTTSGTATITVAIVAAPAMGSVSQSGNGNYYTIGLSHTVTWASTGTRGVGVIINSQGQGEKASNTTLSLTTNYLGVTYGVGSYTVELQPIALATNLSYTGTSYTFSYSIVGAPTVTFGSTASGGNSSTSSSTTVKAGTNAYYNWTTTNATSLVYYINTNGGGYVGPNDITSTLQGPSGPQQYSAVTATTSATQTLYLVATNAAGTTATSSTASITWTPYTEVLTISPTTFSGASGTSLSVTGCYPNESIGYSINNTGYADGTVTANASGTFTNATAFQGSLPGTYTLYIKMATTTHTRQQTITVT